MDTPKLLGDLEPSAHTKRLETYLSLRRAQRRINSDLVRRLSRATIERAARRLGLWERGALVAESEDDFDVLCDFCIYDCFLQGKNAAASYRADRHLHASAEAGAVLDVMSKGAPFSLFRIEALKPRLGARVVDLLMNEGTTLSDEGLARTGRPGLCFGARLLRFTDLDVCMTTGATIGVDPDFARDLVEEVHAELQQDDEDPSEAVRKSGPRERARIAVRILRAALATPIGNSGDDAVTMLIPDPEPSFTEKQGQYLAFINTYAKLHGRPPAEADMQGYFGVTAPTVHQMVLQLHKRGLIRRQPGQARSIEILVDPRALPALQ